MLGAQSAPSPFSLVPGRLTAGRAGTSMAAMITVGSSPRLRSLANLVAAGFGVLLLMFLWFAVRFTVRLARFIDGPFSGEVVEYLLLLFVPPFVAISVAGVVVYSLLRTELRLDDTGRITLRSALRRWDGLPRAVRRIECVRGRLRVTTVGAVLPWTMMLDGEQEEALRTLRGALPPGVWIAETEARRARVWRTILAIVLGLILGLAFLLLFARLGFLPLGRHG
jgi:hypothetical protein